MSNIFLDCFQHIFSYLGTGGDPPDPGEVDGGGCEGTDCCEDDVCDPSPCDDPAYEWECVDCGPNGCTCRNIGESTVGAVIAECAGAADDTCENGYGGLPNQFQTGDCAGRTFSYGIGDSTTDNPGCNLLNCPAASVECIYYRCQSQDPSPGNPCIIDDIIYVNENEICPAPQQGQYLGDATCNGDCEDIGGGGGGQTKPCPGWECTTEGQDCTTTSFNIPVLEDCEDYYNVPNTVGDGIYKDKGPCNAVCNPDPDYPTPSTFLLWHEETYPGLTGNGAQWSYNCLGDVFINESPKGNYQQVPVVGPNGTAWDITNFQFTSLKPGVIFNNNTFQFQFTTGGTEGNIDTFYEDIDLSVSYDGQILHDSIGASFSKSIRSCEQHINECATLEICDIVIDPKEPPFIKDDDETVITSCWVTYFEPPYLTQGVYWSCGGPFTDRISKSELGISENNPCPSFNSPGTWERGPGEFIPITFGYNADAVSLCDTDFNYFNCSGYRCFTTQVDPNDTLAQYTNQPKIALSNFPGQSQSCDGVEYGSYVINQKIGGYYYRKDIPPDECDGVPNDIEYQCQAHLCLGTTCLSHPDQSNPDALYTFTYQSGYDCDSLVGTILPPDNSADLSIIIGNCSQSDCANLPTVSCDYYGRTSAGDCSEGVVVLAGTECPVQCTQYEDGTGVDYRYHNVTNPCPPTDPCNLFGSNMPPGSDDTNFPSNDRKLNYDQLIKRGNRYINFLSRQKLASSVTDSLAGNRKFRERVTYVPVPNSRYTNLLGPMIHASLDAVLKYNESGQTTDTPLASFYDLSYPNLMRSLRPDIRKKIEGKLDSNGKKLEIAIMRAFQKAIIENKLDSFSFEGVEELDMSFDNVEDLLNQTSRYEDQEAYILDLIGNKSKPMDPDQYEGLSRERMRVWKTLAPDLNKAIPLLYETGTLDFHDISIKDTYTVVRSDETEEELNIRDGDFITYLDSKGETKYLDLDTDVDKAVMLDLQDSVEVFNRLGVRYKTKVEVQSAEVRLIEETCDLESPRQAMYILKVDLEDIEDLEPPAKLIRTTKVGYTLMEDDNDITDWISFKPYPYRVFHLLSEDPFFDHLEASKKVSVTYNDISFENLIGYDHVLIPRKIPFYVVIIPTNLIKNLGGDGKSYLDGYNKRFFNAVPLPSSKNNKQNWYPEYLNSDEKLPGDGIDPRDDKVGALKYRLSRVRFNSNKRTYSSGSEPLPRPESPVRKLFRVMKDLKDSGDSFVDEKNTFIPWGEVYKKMSASDLVSLRKYQFPSWINTERKIAANNLATNTTVKERYSKLSDDAKRDIVNLGEYQKPEKVVRARRISGDDLLADTPEEL